MKNDATSLQMGQVLKSVEGLRSDFRGVSDMVTRTDQRTLDLEKDQAATHKALHGNGREGLLWDLGQLRTEMQELRHSLDLHLRNKVVGRKVRWRAITEIAIALTALASMAMAYFS